MINFLLNGLANFSLTELLIYTLLTTHITIISITVYLHRSIAHRSLQLNSSIALFFNFWVWFTTSMIAREWAAVHRKHHAKCETSEDPHSPQVKGLSKVLRFGSELYTVEARNPETIQRYTKDMKLSWFDKFSANNRNLGIKCLLLINVVAFGVPGVAVWAIQMIWSPFFAAGVINGVGHYLGYRNHNCPDASRNISPIGILIGGEELHNNHHANPTSAKLSFKWYEFDIGWMYIKLLESFGLAQPRKAPSVFSFSPLSSSEIKMHIMHYTEQAIKRKNKFILKSEKKADSFKKDILEQLKVQKEKLEELRTRCLELFSNRTISLMEMETNLEDLISQLQSLGVNLRLSK